MHSDQQALLANLRKHSFSYKLGYLLKTDGVYHEKGVDVNLAIDMLVAAYENICNNIILISSDTDLIPAVKKVQSKGVAVHYIGFSHKRNYAMVGQCSSYKLIEKEELLKLAV